MKLFTKCKDGGKDSPVDAYVLIEIKGLFSIMFLKFNKGRREAYHTHAFNAWTWFIKGSMVEQRIDTTVISSSTRKNRYKRSWLPKVTLRDNLHRVVAHQTSWCFTLRGAWDDTWTEYLDETKEYLTLTHGRKVVGKCVPSNVGIKEGVKL